MRPVFIGGCERSGTTLVGSILGAVQGHVCTPESQFKHDILTKHARGDYEPHTVVQNLLRHRKLLAWEITLDANRLHRAAEEGPAALLVELAVQFNEQHGPPSDELHWVDHSPSNMRDASLLMAHFPEARFVHVVRDGRAVAASLIPQDWGPNHIDQAAGYWLSQVCVGIAAEQGPWKERVFRVRYEDILEHPEHSIRKLCESLAIPFHPSTLEARGFRGKPESIASTHPLIGQGLVKDRAQAWRRELTAREVEIFESRAAILLESLQYELLYPNRARAPNGKERLRLELEGLARRSRNAVARRYATFRLRRRVEQ